MHSIGNAHEAQTIAKWVRSFKRECGRPLCVIHAQAPEGWEFLAAGSFRSVWLSPSGIAYKVSHRDNDQYQSEEEVIHLGRAWSRGVPEGCRLPKFEKYITEDDELVVAIERIKGRTLYEHCYRGGSGRCSPSGQDYYDLLGEIKNDLRLNDLHDENAMVDEDGLLVPVDFGG